MIQKGAVQTEVGDLLTCFSRGRAAQVKGAAPKNVSGKGKKCKASASSPSD